MTRQTQMQQILYRQGLEEWGELDASEKEQNMPTVRTEPKEVVSPNAILNRTIS